MRLKTMFFSYVVRVIFKFRYLYKLQNIVYWIIVYI